MIRRSAINALVVGAIFFLSGMALAQEAAPKAVVVERGIYLYDEKGRRDPFVSLIQTKTTVQLTGDPLRDNDVSQMRVIAIVQDAEESYALFGLPDGKFYTIKEGTMIGLHGGKVESILEDSVLIKELKPDFRGTLKPVETYLRLRKEGQ